MFEYHFIFLLIDVFALGIFIATSVIEYKFKGKIELKPRQLLFLMLLVGLTVYNFMMVLRLRSITG